MERSFSFELDKPYQKSTKLDLDHVVFSRCPSFAWVFKIIIESYCAKTQFDSLRICYSSMKLIIYSATRKNMNTWNIPGIFVKTLKPQKYRKISSKWIPNACLSLLKIIYYPELISRGCWTGGFCNGSCCFNCPPAGTAEIRFWRCDTVFCWSSSSPFKIQNTSTFKLVFKVSLVGDEKPQNLRVKTEKLIFKLRLLFPSSFPHIKYCAKDKLCLHS